jgi:hypothetical protein
MVPSASRFKKQHVKADRLTPAVPPSLYWVMEVVVKTRPMEPSSGSVLASMLSLAREGYGLWRPEG